MSWAGEVIKGVYLLTRPTLANNQEHPPILDATGTLLVTDAGSTSPATAPVTSSYTPKSISFAASGDNTAIAAVAAQTTRVFAVSLTFAAPVDVTIKDGSTVLGVFQGITSLTLDPLWGNPRYIGTANTNFVVNLSAAVSCKGTIWYTQS